MLQAKAKYCSDNWSDYSKARIQRESITVSFSEASINTRHVSIQSGKKGRPQIYADKAILPALLISRDYLIPCCGRGPNGQARLPSNFASGSTSTPISGIEASPSSLTNNTPAHFIWETVLVDLPYSDLATQGSPWEGVSYLPSCIQNYSRQAPYFRIQARWLVPIQQLVGIMSAPEL